MMAKLQALVHGAWTRFRSVSAYIVLFFLVLLGVLATEGVFDRARMKRVVAAFKEPEAPPAPVIYQPADLANQVREFETSKKTSRKELDDRRAELESSEARLKILQAELGPREQNLDKVKKDFDAEKAAFAKAKSEAEVLAASAEYQKFLKVLAQTDAKTAAGLLRGRDLAELKRIFLDLKSFNAAEILDLWMKDPQQNSTAQELAKYLTKPPTPAAPVPAPGGLASTPGTSGQ